MILLDTNVLSEPMRPAPAPEVVAWLDQQASETLYLSSVTMAEMLFGVACLPDGRRKTKLSEACETILAVFDGRILAFDAAAARLYGEMAAAARSAGQGFPTPDGYIAAIAAAHGYTVATRDEGAFKAAGVATINPWRSASRDID
ncbi:type II toxin-antitoxin system VapC family toxin [Rhizobium sp. FY34]|uniref:type II toxin-antitoxin system VapC family toxin n=1 Tax=Rhizobium sp. FY34 TaxID=2562309 RepID=UPI0010C0532C|nr:type II toxin-antitoxin system VapC family toxin [Rhizobium sp. FY34]